jgi:hypothetical protein
MRVWQSLDMTSFLDQHSEESSLTMDLWSFTFTVVLTTPIAEAVGDFGVQTLSVTSQIMPLSAVLSAIAQMVFNVPKLGGVGAVLWVPSQIMGMMTPEPGTSSLTPVTAYAVPMPKRKTLSIATIINTLLFFTFNLLFNLNYPKLPSNSLGPWPRTFITEKQKRSFTRPPFIIFNLSPPFPCFIDNNAAINDS